MAKRLKNKLKNIEELEQKFSENVEMCFRDDSAYYKLKQKLKEFLDNVRLRHDECVAQDIWLVQKFMELIVSKYSKQIQFKQANKVMKIEMKNSFRNPEETLKFIIDLLIEINIKVFKA